jgi:signal transduction histidine kinase
VIADLLRRRSSRKRFDEYFTILDNEIYGLSSSLSKWLSISRVEYKHLRPEFEKFDLSKLIRNIEKEITTKLAKRKKIKFRSTINPGISLVGDSDLIKVAVENILDNAIKYTLDGHISLNLYDEPGNAKIMIEDSGIGIAPEDIEKIYDQGFRCDHKVVKQRDGQGIGLYQCKQYINLNGGRFMVC